MTGPLWTWDALAAAAGGIADGQPKTAITGFSIDTRGLAAGEVFVALTHARDGHDFVGAAFAAGAAAALVRADYTRQPGDGALLRVPDPLRALERIGVAARSRLSPEARVVAVTGSAGKTGTKEMLRACLSPLGPTHAPEKSFNNQWGVPLTLARMPAATRYAVIEIGMNHAGEISPLTCLTRPHVALIVNVLPVHVGNFADGEIGVANAKAEIFEGLDGDGVAVLPFDNSHFARLQTVARARTARQLTFGSSPGADVRAEAIDGDEAGSSMRAAVAGRSFSYRVGAPGQHLALNSLAVVAVLHVLGLASDATLTPLARTAAPAGRGARSVLELEIGGALLLIDESYNANPASMRAALAALAMVPRAEHPRRIAILGDMRELGEGSSAYHRDLLAPVTASGADLVFACGPFMQELFDRLPADRRGAWAPTSIELVPAVRAALRAGDVVMVKGSLGTNMAPLVAAIRSRLASAPPAKS